MSVLIAQGEREPSQISAESPVLRVTLVTISFSGISNSFSEVFTKMKSSSLLWCI